MYLFNSVRFNPDFQHTIGDTQYPPNWFKDPLERAKIGIVEVADPPRPDPALFDSAEAPDGSWTSAPRLPEVIAAESRARELRVINDGKSMALESGVVYDGHLYHSDLIFQCQLQAFILAWLTGTIAPTAAATIRRKDGVSVQMKREEVSALAGALLAYVQGVYVASWQAKDGVI